jgi:hypothetical protein
MHKTRLTIVNNQLDALFSMYLFRSEINKYIEKSASSWLLTRIAPRCTVNKIQNTSNYDILYSSRHVLFQTTSIGRSPYQKNTFLRSRNFPHFTQSDIHHRVQKGPLLDPASLTNLIWFTPSYMSLGSGLTSTSN